MSPPRRLSTGRRAGQPAPPIIKRYLQKAPGARPHIPVDRHAALADFQAIAARYPVFRVVPLQR
jgi:hypothetical protein